MLIFLLLFTIDGYAQYVIIETRTGQARLLNIHHVVIVNTDPDA